jgi:hypothetical protein
MCCDYSIERLRNSGILKRLNDNALPVPTMDSKEPDAQATLEEILPILYILVTGFLASTLCLLAEMFVFRLRNRFSQQHVNCSTKFFK